MPSAYGACVKPTHSHPPWNSAFRERGEREREHAQEVFSPVIPDWREILLSELHGRVFIGEGYSGFVSVAAQMLAL